MRFFFFFESTYGNAHFNFLQITRYINRTWPFVFVLDVNALGFTFRTRPSLVDLYVYTRFLFTSSLGIKISYVGLPQASLCFLYVLSNSCFNAAPTTACNQVFRLATALQIFVIYSENVHSSSSGCVCLVSLYNHTLPALVHGGKWWRKFDCTNSERTAN